MSRIDIDKHRELQAAGFLFINAHETAPLLIHNYSQSAQYERHWTPETLMCRGLITDLEGNIVARPFHKFFNLDEHIQHFGDLPEEPFDVYEKMDGSLGILYFHDRTPTIATRGSFNSPQSVRANEILRRKYSHVDFDPSYTYLFEIIYPENRIVVDYGDMSELVLLGMVHTKTGEEIPPADIGMPLVKHYDGIRDLETLRSIEEVNREGFVVRFRNGLRVKVKFEEYVRLHRIITGVTARVIWEYMSEGQGMEALLEQVPDEFFKWVRNVQTGLRGRYEAIEARAKAEFRTFQTRKDAAEYFLNQCTDAPILFKMLDDKSYDDIIWRMIYPEHQTPFTGDETE